MVTIGIPGVTNTSQPGRAARVGSTWAFAVFAGLDAIGDTFDLLSDGFLIGDRPAAYLSGGESSGVYRTCFLGLHLREAAIYKQFRSRVLKQCRPDRLLQNAKDASSPLLQGRNHPRTSALSGFYCSFTRLQSCLSLASNFAPCDQVEEHGPQGFRRVVVADLHLC